MAFEWLVRKGGGNGERGDGRGSGRKTDRQRETDRKRERQTERGREQKRGCEVSLLITSHLTAEAAERTGILSNLLGEMKRGRERERQREKERANGRERESERERERQREKERKRQRGRERQREREVTYKRCAGRGSTACGVLWRVWCSAEGSAPSAPHPSAHTHPSVH